MVVNHIQNNCDAYASMRKLFQFSVTPLSVSVSDVAEEDVMLSVQWVLSSL